VSGQPAPSGQPAESPAAPKLRADALRNRERVLEAARALFAERGSDVQMEEVAHRAGVGVGTLYRHFPTKEAMIEAASVKRFEEALSFARSECSKDADPWNLLVEIMTHCAEVQSRDRGFCLVVESTMGSNEPSCQMQAQFEDVMAELLRRGQAAGSIRPEIVANDLYAITCGVAAVIRNQSGDWHRFLDIVLQGLRTR
jgi:AcrR family transcriptional regulator